MHTYKLCYLRLSLSYQWSYCLNHQWLYSIERTGTTFLGPQKLIASVSGLHRPQSHSCSGYSYWVGLTSHPTRNRSFRRRLLQATLKIIDIFKFLAYLRKIVQRAESSSDCPIRHCDSYNLKLKLGTLFLCIYDFRRYCCFKGLTFQYFTLSF